MQKKDLNLSALIMCFLLAHIIFTAELYAIPSYHKHFQQIFRFFFFFENAQRKTCVQLFVTEKSDKKTSSSRMFVRKGFFFADTIPQLHSGVTAERRTERDIVHLSPSASVNLMLFRLKLHVAEIEKNQKQHGKQMTN